MSKLACFIRLRVKPRPSGRDGTIEFGKLLQLVADQPRLTQAIDALLAKKRLAPEMGLSEPVSVINEFIETELVRLETISPQRIQRSEVISRLNALFHATLDERY